MKEEHVIAFLRYPVAALVDLALTFANLTWQEERALTLCGRKNYTQEQAAEKLECSTIAIHRWYRSGLAKLGSAWSGSEWIEKLVQ